MLDKNKIYEDYHMKVLRYIQGKVNDYYLAEDICSDVFVKVYEKLDTFDETKASISTWIFTITRNKLIDYYRSRKVTVEIPDDLTYEIDESFINDEMLESLAKGLEKLNDNEKRIIVDHYYNNKTIKDIAKDLGISYIYAKVIHKKALNKLKEYINK